MSFIVSAIVAYLLGSISCAVLVAKFLKIPDPRTHGSGNAGATNVLRQNGTKAGIYVLIGDFVKGLLAMIVAILMGVQGTALGFIALAAVLGHVFPVFFKFRGGKGVATAAGVLFAISLWTLFFTLIVFAAVLYFTRFVSLSSIASVIAAPMFLLVGGNYIYFFPFALMAVLIIWRHKDNIQRLRAGTENKVSFK